MSDPQKPPDNYPGMHILAKPIGAACNLNCDYCFYLEKSALFPHHEDYRMSEEVLEAFSGIYKPL